MRPLLLLLPELSKLRHQWFGCATRRSQAPVLGRLLWLQPVRTKHLLGPIRAFLLCGQVSPYFFEMKLQLTLKG